MAAAAVSVGLVGACASVDNAVPAIATDSYVELKLISGIAPYL
jgi:hypothetical protein